MRIFITGMAGFIGYHLSLALIDRGLFVMGCDNFNAYYDPALKRERARLLQVKGAQVVEVDIAERSILETLVKEHGITHFVHLAAQAGVRYSIHHPEVYVDTNLAGFVSILELMRAHSHLQFIYASSSSVYGENPKVPFAETDSTDRPCSLYGATKKAGEVLAYSYHHMYGISAIGLRFFTVYGPWGRPDMAYFSFTQAIEEGREILIYNEGKMQRDFTYIDDIVQGILAALDLPRGCEIFNLGNCRPEGVLTLVQSLEELLGKKAKVKFLPLEKSELPITYADIGKAERILGFQPRVGLKEGLERFVEWYKYRGF